MYEIAGRVSTAVPARTGLAGHPSDAFGGAVLAAPVPELRAEVTVEPSAGVVIGDRRFSDLAELLAVPPDGETALLCAATAELVSWMGGRRATPPDDGFRLTASTTIPRSVGLAGSSALVIGALRSLAGAWGVEVPDEVGPRLALAAEVGRLGIAAGPQDRIVQWHGTTVLMDFGDERWSVEAVHPPVPVELLVCWTDASPAPSQATHAPLQQRAGDPAVRERMASLARSAHDAATALHAGDIGALGACLDAGFDHRRALVPLDPSHVAIVDGLRALGASATYTGSGGAVVAVAGEVEPLRTWAVQQGLGALVTTLV
jgi:glucuronokinase